MTSTHTTEPTTGESYTTLATRFAIAVNTAELDLVAFLTTIPANTRQATALAVRRRTPREAHRYTHAADLATRMPDLFASLRTDGRYSVDHLDAIWTRIHRHTRALTTTGAQIPTTVDAAAAAAVDAAVALGVTEWIQNTGITCHTALADVTDEVLCQVAPLIVQDTEAEEAGAVSLTRRGTRLTLDCGSQITAEAVWSAINTAALETRRETMTDQSRDAEAEHHGHAQVAPQPPQSPPAPLMAHCRGQVALRLLGGHRDQLTVTVNTYQTHPDQPCYVLGSGWVTATTGGELAALATRVRELPDPASIPDTEAYRFTTVQKAWIQGRDGYCRFPGCQVPADACEHDHLVNSPHTDPGSDGPTSVTNGICLCRTHHTLKTARAWQPASPDDAVTLHWAGPGGVHATTVAAGPLSPVRHPD
ncbi:HNH endonuclease signature motif containing protein [Corynebacterium glyciniphilum]|uniref:HNH endonuclease signature motif containing protein n=1 Tax=Corynebacterium glyciniphilum TaxID=1404244 RepID=UPI00264BFABF|nr:HNH endonuclease signature motif containing protein [Corynebacterium glyciniphilum]MDN6705387.1 HNH endonuclease [Corynebacterium glyciniphilum]